MEIENRISIVEEILDARKLEDEFRLLPWIKWMEKVDFEGKWGNNA
jgi:hypothetical protein